MQRQERRRQRDSGLAKVGSLTRAAVAAGVVASAALTAQTAGLLPGHASASGSSTTTSNPKTLTPPSEAPQPATTAPSITSGGS